jgi:predicted ATPase
VPPLSAERLPVRLAPLVGRQRELSDVLAALSDCRLLTLTGPGGTGKTTLALAAAGAAGELYSAGVCWVELAPVDDSQIVGQEVASRIGVPDRPGVDPARAVAEHIADRQFLLVLDNCEHLTAAAARLAEVLLSGCPGLSILATSREVLGVDGERSWPVPPLSLPDPRAVPDARAGPGYRTIPGLRLPRPRSHQARPASRMSRVTAARPRHPSGAPSSTSR